MFCCFRWILVLFKREFIFEDIKLIWECIWSAPTSQFHLFVALAILNIHRKHIMNYCNAFDELLKYINNLSLMMNVNEIIDHSRFLWLEFKNIFNSQVSQDVLLTSKKISTLNEEDWKILSSIVELQK